MPGPFLHNGETALSPRARATARLPAAFVLMAAFSSCRLASLPSAPEAGSSQSAAYETTFRGFHQIGFPKDKWVVTGDALKSVAGAGIDLITLRKYRDFELDLEWKVTEGANSGILYGVTEETSETYWSGPEYQINDDPHHGDGRNPITSAGALYGLIPPNNRKRLQPTGVWNRTRIVSRLGHVEHWLNGWKILEYEWGSPRTLELIQKSKFASHALFMRDRAGHIALQHHGAEVWFRNIRITGLSAGSLPAANQH